MQSMSKNMQNLSKHELKYANMTVMNFTLIICDMCMKFFT